MNATQVMSLAGPGLLLACALGAGASAQPSPGPAVTPAMRAAANDAYRARDWKAAAKLYAAIVAADGNNAAAHARYGETQLELNQPREALRHFAIALASAPAPRVAFLSARAHARLGEVDQAYAALDTMVAGGGLAVATLTGARDLAALAGPRWQPLLDKNAHALEPCRASPAHRQFDFWIGDWTVTSPTGDPAGTSSVQLILGGCTVVESWTPAGAGVAGKSFNFYDRSDKKWHQTWVDDRGQFNHYVGGLVDGKMVIVADTGAPGKPGLARMTFSRRNDREVRQLGESSGDGGKSWTVSFDLVYHKRP
jgi:hypothetical protein